MSSKQINPYAQKWLLDNFYNSISNNKYTISKVKDERLGNYHKRHLYKDLLSTMYSNKRKALDLDERGFTIDEQIQTGFQDKEILAAMYDNMQSAKKLNELGISYDMQAKLGEKWGRYFQELYNKTDKIEEFVEKNEIPPAVLTGYLMKKGEPDYLIAENNPKKTLLEIKKVQSCTDFLYKIVPNMVIGLFSGSSNAGEIPEDISREIAEQLVSQSSGAKDFRSLVKLSEVNKSARQSFSRL